MKISMLFVICYLSLSLSVSVSNGGRFFFLKHRRLLQTSNLSRVTCTGFGFKGGGGAKLLNSLFGLSSVSEHKINEGRQFVEVLRRMSNITDIFGGNRLSYVGVDMMLFSKEYSL
jgi:hypothetical protein